MRSYTIYEWMYEFDFPSLEELNAYAIIYAFSRNGDYCDYSIKQFQTLLKCGNKKVLRNLVSLEEKGFIEVERVVLNKVKRNHYKALNPADFN